MSDPINPTPVQATAPRKNSAQSKAVQAYIADAEVFLSVASSDVDIVPLLAARGYEADDFAAGSALATAAHGGVQQRAGGMGHQSLASEKLAADIVTSRDEYAAFRKIARASFTQQSDQLILSLTGRVPEDTSRFITVALASYAAAGLDPQAIKLTKRGYPTAVLAPLIEALNALTASSGDQDAAEGDAIDDTSGRDAAYDALREFMRELKGVAKGALRGQPGLLAKLKL